MAVPREQILTTLDLCVTRQELKAKRSVLEHNRQSALGDLRQSNTRIKKLLSGSRLNSSGTIEESADHLPPSGSLASRIERALYNGMMPTDDDASAIGFAERLQRRRMLDEAQETYERGRAQDLQRMKDLANRSSETIRQLDDEISQINNQIAQIEQGILSSGVVPFRFWSYAKALRSAMTGDNPSQTLYDAVVRLGIEGV